MRYVAATAALAAAFTPLASSADGNAGIVYGHVFLSTTHQPVCPITVRVESNREPAWETHTLSDGSFIFLQIRPGPVTIVVGRYRETRTVNVSANLEEDQNFYLDPLRQVRHREGSADQSGAARKDPCPSAYHGYMYTDYDATRSW